MKLQPFGLNLPGHLGDLDDSSTEDVHVPLQALEMLQLRSIKYPTVRHAVH